MKELKEKLNIEYKSLKDTMAVYGRLEQLLISIWHLETTDKEYLDGLTLKHMEETYMEANRFFIEELVEIKANGKRGTE